MPDWSISAKLNNNPGVTDNSDPSMLDWTTIMYKIPGYCPERIFPDDPDAPCKGGEWFWFLYRDGFLSFDYDSETPASECITFLPEGLRLRNTTIETYDMSYCQPQNQDIGDDPTNCTPEKVLEDPHQFSSGGCMNCHFSSGTDSSFIWADGIEEQIPLN